MHPAYDPINKLLQRLLHQIADSQDAYGVDNDIMAHLVDARQIISTLRRNIAIADTHQQKAPSS